MSQITTYPLAYTVGSAVLDLPLARAFTGALLGTVFEYLQDSFAPPNDPLLDRIFGMAVPDKQEGEEAWCTMARRCKDLAIQVINGELPRYQAVAQLGQCRMREVPCPNSDRVNAVAVFPNGDFLVAVTCSNGATDSVRKFRQDGQLIGQYNLHAGEVRKLAIARDGKSFLTARDNTFILSSDAGKELRRFSYDTNYRSIDALAFFPSGNEFLICIQGPNNYLIEKWDQEKRQVIMEVPSPLRAIRIFPDGSGFVAVSRRGIAASICSIGKIYKIMMAPGLAGAFTDALVLSKNRIVVAHRWKFGDSWRARAIFYDQQGNEIRDFYLGKGYAEPRIAASQKSEDAFFFTDAEKQSAVRVCWGKDEDKFLTPQNTRGSGALAAFTDGSGFVAISACEKNPTIRICDFDLNPDAYKVIDDGTILNHRIIGSVLRRRALTEKLTSPENKDSKENKRA